MNTSFPLMGEKDETIINGYQTLYFNNSNQSCPPVAMAGIVPGVRIPTVWTTLFAWPTMRQRQEGGVPFWLTMIINHDQALVVGV